MTNRKPTRKELEEKIVEQEKTIEKLEQNWIDSEEHNDDLEGELITLTVSIEKLTKDNRELFSANLSLSEQVNQLQEEIRNRSIIISNLDAKIKTIVMLMQNFYWSPITLKKDIRNIIKE